MTEGEAMSERPAEFQRAVSLLGGAAVLERPVANRLDAHRAIRDGLPGRALTHLVENLRVLKRSEVDRAVGMSVRTLQRRKGEPDRPLSPEQGGRTWKFAEVLAAAIDVFGGQEDAERWLERPALGLDGHRPIDLLETPAGTEMVEELLGRLAYGVYV
jgi:putative toxin-antitoxin system antitoxin component (TIGR02293 family)